LRLWDYARAAWGRPGVEAACLALQDTHGQCIPLLLWRAWAASEGRPAGDLAGVIDLARTWEDEVIASLRGARRRLAGESAVRERVRAAELAAERRLLELLETETPAPNAARDDLGHALTTLARAWNGAAMEDEIAALARLLR
jgi:uncharacterized protein (TIGR02444 family)